MEALDAKQVAAAIRTHITSYINGGPDTETQDLELVRKVGLNEDVIRGAWTDAREKKALFISPPISPTQQFTVASQLQQAIEKNVAANQLVEKLRAITDWTEFCQSAWDA